MLQDFGDTLSTGIYNGSVGNVSDNSRGVVGGGYNDTSYAESQCGQMQYITIDNTGNATDFGDLLDTRYLEARLQVQMEPQELLWVVTIQVVV